MAELNFWTIIGQYIELWGYDIDLRGEKEAPSSMMTVWGKSGGPVAIISHLGDGVASVSWWAALNPGSSHPNTGKKQTIYLGDPKWEERLKNLLKTSGDIYESQRQQKHR